MLKLITGTRGPSKAKAIALAVFSGVRTAQEIAEAWRESGNQLPNA